MKLLDLKKEKLKRLVNSRVQTIEKLYKYSKSASQEGSNAEIFEQCDVYGEIQADLNQINDSVCDTLACIDDIEARNKAQKQE